MASEQLIIEVNFKDHDAKTKVDALTSSIEALNAATSGSGFKSLGEVSKNLAKISESSAGLEGIGRKFTEIAIGSKKLFDTFKTFDPKAYSENIKSLTNSLNSISNAVGNLSRKGSGLKGVVDAMQKIPSAMNMGNGANFANMQSSAKSTTSIFKGLGSDMKKVISLGWQISKLPMKMILSPVQAVGRGLEGMTHKFTGFLSAIGRISLYRAIRTGIKFVTTAVREGVNNLYEWSTLVGNSFQQTMNSIATSLNYAKNSIGAMFSPILDAIAPVLDAIVDKCVSVINVINQMIATLTGASTWRRAEKIATTYGGATDNLGKSANNANEKYKELKRTLLGFDEINKLNDDSKSGSNSPSGSGGGSSVPGGSLAFTEQPISSAVKDLAQKLKDAWAKADFTEIGTMIGEKIGNALMNVPWESKIQPTVVKVAKSFGTLLNGMFDYTGSGGKAMWDGIAYTIYNAINTAVLGYVTFFDTVNWNGIGQGIGAALRQVLQNLDWKMIARGLAAFPNAMIDAITGFCKQMTVADFYEAGQNIGQTVSDALAQINWNGLFGNAIAIATRIVAALNGALTSFDWESVKGAIIGGIKKISPSSWKNLGTQIGHAIFNVANFVANLVDTLISAIKVGNWGKLVEGIKEGFNNSMKQYGGWPGVAKMLGKWIVDNIGTITALLTITLGINALKNAAGALLSGKLFASMVTSAPLIGGGTLATIGTLGAFLAACVIAVPVGLTITPIIMEKVDDLVQKFVDTMDPIINPTVEKVFDVITNKNYKPNKIYTGGANAGEKGSPSSTTYKRDLGNGGSVWQLPSGDLNLPNINIDKALETARKRAKENPVTFTAEIEPKTAQVSWDMLSKQWENITKTNKVAKFVTEGLKNGGQEWWDSLKQYWNAAILGKKTSKFQTEGVQNQGSLWKSQAFSGWLSAITGVQASPFTIAGVRDEGNLWWNQTTGYWGIATANSNLQASVEVSNEWNAFANAYNTMQGYFNSHPLTAIVQTSTQNTTNFAKSYQSSGTSTNNKNKKKANGGIYKNGVWHDITKYASGALGVGSGEMFIAREAGPELVGTIGGSTAVLNNDQIVSSVAVGVKQAVYEAMGAGGNTNDITIKIDSETLYRAVRKGERKASGRYSTVVAVG